MAAVDPSGAGWIAVLRRQPARVVDGRPEGGCTDMFEIISCDCGDDPSRQDAGLSPGLQLVRGPYPMALGVAAYERHLGLHQQPGLPPGEAGER
jgi:hypothetical protein